MRPIVSILWCFLIGVSLATAANATSLSIHQAAELLRKAVAEREALHREWVQALQEFLDYRSRKFDPEKWELLRETPPPWNRAEHDRLLKEAHDALKATERGSSRVEAARDALKAAQDAAAKAKGNIGRIPPPKPPKLEGPLTKGPKTIPDIGDTFPGPIDPHDPWPFPWKKPKC